MSKVKKQHYVPQGYLRNFSSASSTGKEEHIFTFDKTTKKCFSSNIKDIASSKYFYDIPDEMISKLPDKFKDTQIIEKSFSKVESNCFKVL